MSCALRRLGSRSSWPRATVAALALLGLGGCAAIQPIDAIPATLVPSVLQGQRRADRQEIDLVRLRQTPPAEYRLGGGDVLGIYIDNILGERLQPIPVNFSPDGPPSIGYPIPIREDGTISLPLVRPLKVDGLTLAETERLIAKAYTEDQQLLQPGARILVTRMRPRTYKILVIRQEAGGAGGGGKRGTGSRIDLPAYENDVLNALAETGGMPGLDAKNEILIIRGAFADAQERDRLLGQLWDGREECFFMKPQRPDDPNIVRIPIRFDPQNPPVFDEKDIILRTGDIVLIESRETEFFYAGGLLGGGQIPLPRDYDLDVLGAIAAAGGPIPGGGTGGQGLFGSGGGGGGGFPPTDVVVIRNVPGGGQIPIKVDLRKALVNASERIPILPGDTVILRYKPQERFANMIVGSFGINFIFTDLFRSR